MKNHPGSLWQTSLLTDPDTKIELLFTTLLINQKARNVCHLNGIYTLRSLVNHYQTKGTFVNLSSCGEITSKELIEYVQKVLTENPEPYQSTAKEHPLALNLKELRSSDSGKIFEQYSNLLSSLLPVRAGNAVNKVFNNQDALFDFKRWILLKERPNEIEKVGKASVGYIAKYVATSLAFIDTLRTDTFAAIVEYFELFMQAAYEIEHAKRFIHITNDKIYLSALFEEVLKKHPKTKGKRYETLDKLNGVFGQAESLSQKDFLNYIKLSNERIRQISMGLPERIKSAFEPLRYFIQPLKKYFPDIYYTDSHCIMIDKQTFDRLSKSDRKHLSIKGLAYYLFALSDKLSAIYPHPDATHHPQYLLLSNTLFQTFQLPEFIKSVKNTIDAKRVEDEKIDLKAMASAWPEETDECYSSFLFALKHLLKNEYELDLTDQQYIELPRNRKPNQWEYLEAILQKQGTPMHLEKIFEQAQIDIPGEFEKPEQLRSAILRNKKIFFAIGKTSTYGLNIWKTDTKLYRSEPIAELVYQWLQKSDMPKHHFDITRYIRIFRDSKDISIINILKLDENDRFRFLPGGFIGLYEKEYKGMRIPFNNPDADTEAMIIHMVHDQGPVNKIDLINKTARRYGLETVQIEHIIDGAIKKNIIQKVNEFLL